AAHLLGERPGNRKAAGESALRLRCVRSRPVASLGHELVEFALVLGKAQAVEEIAELALLLFEPAQRLGAVFVEGVIAARRRPPRPEAAAEALHALAHAAHLFFHARHFALPALATMATHVSAPECEGEDREADRPPHDESEDQQDDPGRVNADRGTAPAVVPVFVITFSGGHGFASPV